MWSTRVTFDRRLAVSALSVFGWVFGVGLWLRVTGGEIVPGVDMAAYIRAGSDLLAGRPVYIGVLGERLVFSYAPTWAVAFAALSWLPGALLQAAIMVLDLLSLRYVAGSWQRAGLVFLFPITVFVIVAGNLELLIAAAIALAWRTNRVEPLVFLALAKVAPALAIPPRNWRAALIALAVAVAVTLPWLGLWREWIEYLLRQPAVIAISIPVPWYFRLPVALLLYGVVRRPWAAALAVVIAMPSLYLSSLLILLAPLRLYLDERAARQRAAAAAPTIAAK